MSEPATLPPRWEVVITPTANMEGSIAIRTFAEDVVCAEVAHVLAKVVAHLTKFHTQRLPTEEELRAQQDEQALLAAHPATKLFVKDGEQLWLGESAPTAGLVAAGWVYAGPVPEGVKRICAWGRDPSAFESKYPNAEA